MHVLLQDSEKNTHREDYKEEQKKEPAEKQEIATPWILFSIIWYLTMIREQAVHGMYGKNPSKKIKKAKKTSHTVKRAVIFTFDQRFLSQSVPMFVL